MKNKAFLIIIILSITIFSFSKDSYLKLDKLKSIIKEQKSDNLKIQKKIKQPEIFIKNRKINSTVENSQRKEKESSAFIKPELLGMIINLDYRAALLKYNEQYLYLKEGETDYLSKIKILNIGEKKVILKIDNKKLELEVKDE